MPTISQFYGITIRMYFDDHPPPHFHAYYGSEAAKIDIDTLQLREASCAAAHWRWFWNGPSIIAMNCARIGAVPKLTFH